MNNFDHITNFIEDNTSRIIQNIGEESIDVYLFLKNQFESGNIQENFLFQFVYRSFYRLDNAGLSNAFKEEYFVIFEEIRRNNTLDFSSVLQRLSQFPNLKGQSTFQFSFVSKMFNTIDDTLPIYDSKVAKVFAFKKTASKNFNQKLDHYSKQLEIIQNSYERILNQQLLPKTVVAFDQQFSNYQLADAKKLDFIFWAAGKLKDQ